MATAKVEVPPSDIILTLRLTQEEAFRLKVMLQNPIGLEEDPVEGHVRGVIWAALNDAKVRG